MTSEVDIWPTQIHTHVPPPSPPPQHRHITHTQIDTHMRGVFHLQNTQTYTIHTHTTHTRTPHTHPRHTHAPHTHQTYTPHTHTTHHTHTCTQHITDKDHTHTPHTHARHTHTASVFHLQSTEENVLAFQPPLADFSPCVLLFHRQTTYPCESTLGKEKICEKEQYLQDFMNVRAWTAQRMPHTSHQRAYTFGMQRPQAHTASASMAGLR